MFRTRELPFVLRLLTSEGVRVYESDNKYLSSLSFCLLGFVFYSRLACAPGNNVKIIKEEKIAHISKEV